LGLGLVITSLVFLLQPSPEITEEEIIQRARELDMVFKEEVVVFEEEALEEGISEEELAEEDSSEVAETDEVQEDRESVQNDEDNDEKDFAEDEEEEYEDEEKDEEKDEEEMVEVTIPSGYYLTKIATLLEEEGVLADKESFIQLTREMDVSHKLRRGIYQLPREGEPLEVLNILMEGGDSID